MEGTINTNYTRVVPRDLFNESMLLKSLGQLSLLVLDNKIKGLTCKNSGLGFKIGQINEYLTTTKGIRFYKGREELFLCTTVNSRSNYPLICYRFDAEIEVFNEDGTITEEFQAMLNE